MAILNNSNAISSGGYDINNSLRFRSSASAYLNRTPAGAGSLTTWTFSAWVKRGAVGTTGRFISVGTSASDQFGFLSTDTFQFVTDSTGQNLVTTQVFRDPSAWYHMVVVNDTTQATASNRVKLYVNGSQVTAFSTATYPAQNSTGTINSASAHNIGRRLQTAGEYFDGYMTEVNFIDGQALTPSSFGETDTTTGSWKPKAYTSTYGTNGFYLKFSDIATTSGSNAGLGKDFSGNANYWTTNNISVTAGTTYDAMIDSPTLTSATVSNYCTLNPVLQNAYWAGPNRGNIINGNLTLSQNNGTAFSTFDVNTSGKWYLEATVTTYGQGASPSAFIISAVSRATFECNYLANGQKQLNGAVTSAYGSSWTTGDIIGIAIDPANNQITYYKNGTSQGAITQTFPSQTLLVGYYAEATGTDVINFNFGQRPFTYTPPTGFVRLNTYNLPDSTIKKGSTVMDATLYTGTATGAGANTITITNAAGFKPDFVWAKGRSVAYVHGLFNSVVGAEKFLVSNNTNAELVNETDGYLTSFNSNGFTLGNGSNSNLTFNSSPQTYVAWQWQAGQGTNTSNTSGSITSTVSVNTTAGFSIATFTGTGANATVGHGLGVAPAMYIVKNRSAGSTNWVVYHKSLGATKWIELSQTTAAQTSSSLWNNTAPTSTVFSVGNAPAANGSTNNMVAYCWAEIAGFSAFGSYTGNGSTDGPFVYTGFRPKFIIYKNASAVTDWVIFDSSRGTYNFNTPHLLPNASNAETNVSNYGLDFLSNGFKCRVTDASQNGSGATYIYMAFAENPFKNANAR